jgi:hypothetical protein
MFETKEITKLLDVLIGNVEAVGETNEDNRRLDNLKTLIDVTNWCLDGLQFAMASGYGRPEYSMAEISYTAQRALDEYGRWIADVLDEQMADRKTENCSENPNNCEDLQDWKDRMWAEAIVTESTISKMEQVDEPQTERSSE